MLFISPPFGNYIKLPKTIPIKGSYTLNPRPGLVYQILKNLRFSFEHDGWVNKIGLRNKGLDYAIKNYKKGEEIISIAILEKGEVEIIEKKIPKDMDIELNISCPNIEKDLCNKNLNLFLNSEREWCIIKLKPGEEIDKYYKEGFRQFHYCNTYKTERGGVSGPYLTPYVKNMILNTAEKYQDITIIAGGGVRDINTANNYISYGSDHISVSTLLFNPIKFGIFYYKWINKF